MIKSKSLQQAYDRFLTTLSNKTRLTIIHSLKNSSKNVSQLTNELKIHQTTVSHSLKRLLDCGFVQVEKNGKERIYTVNKKTIKPLLKLMDEHVNNYCTNCNN
jgi:DNA-binding transcriptional ArsR family regulator